MRFKRIVLKNLFSYYGEITFDLTGGNGDSNIVLISGRNGYGKTSFIRSLKLLFSGTEESLTLSVIGRAMGQKRFVMGDGKTWLGIMNRKAALEGQTHCRIRVEWEESGTEVVAVRSWDLNGDHFLGDLEIQTNKNLLKDKEAREFLDQRLPSAYIPFFFFDSEQIERLADSTDDESFQKEMEQLLDIAPIDYLREELKKIATEWQRDSMEEEKRLVLFKIQEHLKKEELAIAVEDERQKDWEYQQEEIEQEIKALEDDLSSLEYLQGRQDIDRLKSERNKIVSTREKQVNLLADLIRKESPLLANPDLIQKACFYLEKSAGSRMGAATEILESLKKSLVSGLLEEPPYPSPELEAGQKRFLKKRLIGLIDARIPDKEPGLLSLDIKTAKYLHDRFLSFKGMDYTRQEIQRTLAQIHELTREIASIDFETSEATGLTDDERDRIEMLRTELREKIEQLGGVKQDIRQSQTRKEDSLRQIRQLKSNIREQEKEVDLSKRVREKVNLARELRQFFDAYKFNLRKIRKEAVETAMNKYLKILMPDHLQVNKVAVSDSFALTFLDISGDNIGRTSFSSGIKQLICTALLWALKSVSGKEVPVVIDTPLGRLDADHQKGLLENYYPAVGNQVILLPTDSELDEHKYRLIQPHVYREYRLSNEDGESTTAEEFTMYQVV